MARISTGSPAAASRRASRARTTGSWRRASSTSTWTARSARCATRGSRSWASARRACRGSTSRSTTSARPASCRRPPGSQNTTGFEVELAVLLEHRAQLRRDDHAALHGAARRAARSPSSASCSRGPFGDVRYEILPNDKRADDEDRWAFAVASNLNFRNGLTGLVNYQRVSDDNYFRDLSSRLSIATQLFLPQQGLVAYACAVGELGRYGEHAAVPDPAGSAESGQDAVLPRAAGPVQSCRSRRPVASTWGSPRST